MTALIRATANHPGAIAILQLLDDDGSMLRHLTGIGDWPLHRVRLVDFAGIDQGLAVRISSNITQIMPHGGPRVVQKLTARLVELGATIAQGEQVDSTSPLQLYPEAEDAIEAMMLLALSRAESPLAIDLLLDQPRRWREIIRSRRELTAEDRLRSNRLNRLIHPPVVVLVGAPNVGKSTLSNALLGRSMSITLDMPGTTRDYIAGRINLAELVVDWHDTPGIRESDDPIERKAIEISQRLIARADLLIAMRDATAASPWPNLPREPDVRVINKMDVGASSTADADAIRISAKTGEGMALLVSRLRGTLVPDVDLANSGPWLFDDRLTSPNRQSSI
jgi:tRNA modification GTPase